MRTLVGTLLGAIAVGVLLIAYGLLNPRTISSASLPADSRVDTYQLTRSTDGRFLVSPVGAVAPFGNDANVAATPQLQVRCEPGQRAVIRQLGGATAAECADAIAIDRYQSAQAVSYVPNEFRTVRASQTLPAPRPATRVTRAPGRNWQKTALVIGGSTATGAGLGAIFGGKKGALIGAAIGGGASTLFEATH